MAKDYYSILGVDRNASEKEIRSAYRRLARKHHPDVNPGDKASEALFKEINAANDVLSDPEKRRKYDKYGENWQHADEIERMERQRGPGGTSFRFTSAGPDLGADFDISDILGGLFGGANGRRSRRAEQPPPAVEYAVEVTLEEAFKGTKRTIMVEGDHGETRRLEVTIPPGVDSGSRVRIAGEGQVGFSGRRGDLYLVISVRPSPRFERKGDDVYTDVEVPLSTPVLGGEVEVQGIEKKVALRLPAGTQNGQTFRLKGLGMPKLGQPDKHGDLLARVKVKLPREADAKVRDLFKQLQEAGL
jgi:DnaJ-class molecular chaperone